jgi:predicted secreted protein
MESKIKAINEALKDERSKKVIFVSHCILNSNTRYLGGAFYSGINNEIVSELIKSGYGIIQLPCPEQVVWGGVLKRFIWIPIGSNGKPINSLFKLFFPLFILYTKWRYSRLASTIVSQIKDYIDSGFEVIGLIGVDGSPTCGVFKTLNMEKSFRFISELSIDSLNRNEYNTNLFSICAEKGMGLFIKTLSKKLHRNGVKINLKSVDIENELKQSNAQNKI